MSVLKFTAISIALCSAVVCPASAQPTITQSDTPSTLQDAPTDNLSTKLDKSGGVIAPKGDIDPGIKVQAPVAHPNSTPVIPPAATGGESAK